MTTPEIEPYQPFPGFAEFAAGGFEFAAFDRYAEQLSRAKADVTPDQLMSAVERATRSAAVDTGAIEGLYEVDRGFTLTVATEAAAWENIHRVKGEQVARAIQDALRGYEYVLDLATGSRPITESWLRELHAVLCASQETYRVITEQGEQEQPLPRGEYKRFPNNPLNLATSVVHSYAPVPDTPAEVARLVAELSGEEFLAAHPLLQASYAHYAFVCIHPFADGNGRVARALASVYLYRVPGVPLVVFADQKAEYLDSLELADASDPRAFVQFIEDRVTDTARMVLSDLANAVTETERATRTERLRASLLGRGGLPHDEVDALGVQLLDAWRSALTEVNEAKPPPSPIGIQIHDLGSSAGAAMSHLRPVPRTHGVRAVALVPSPAELSLARDYYVFVAKPEFTDYDLVIVAEGVVVGDFLIRDLNPVVGASAGYRLRSMAEKQLWQLADEAGARAEQALQNKGYR